MRLPRIQFTLRRLTVVVAVIGVIFGAEQFWRRRAFCLERARYHRLHVMFWSGNHIALPIGYRIPDRALRGQRPTHPPRPDYDTFRDVRERDSHIDWHWSVAERFEHAATRP